MIRVRLMGRMGNQMFQFAFAYITAKRLNTLFLLDTWYWEFDLKMFKLCFPYNLLEYKILRILYTKLQWTIKYSNSITNLDCRKTISNKELINNSDYIGYFQDGRIYSPFKDELKRFFKIKEKYVDSFNRKYKPLIAEKKLIVVSVRLGDYKNLRIKELGNAHALIPIDWYIDQLKAIDSKGSTIFVISDEVSIVEAEFRKRVDITCIFDDDSFVHHFQLLMNADIAIISNSTYAWWASFLNSKPYHRIIAPKFFLGYNAGKEFPLGIQIPNFEWR